MSIKTKAELALMIRSSQVIGRLKCLVWHSLDGQSMLPTQQVSISITYLSFDYIEIHITV